LLTQWAGWSSRRYSCNLYLCLCLSANQVVQAYIIGKNDDQYRDMISRVFGVVFLATPHKGANSAKLLNTLLSTYPLASSKIYISELERNSGWLRDINDQFRTVCEGLKLVSFYETRKTNLRVAGNRIVSFYLFIYRRAGLMPHSSLRRNLPSLDTRRRKHPNLMRTIMGCASLRMSMIQSISSSETCLGGLQRVLDLSVSCGVPLLSLR
jgi:hypothetical protein